MNGRIRLSTMIVVTLFIVGMALGILIDKKFFCSSNTKGQKLASVDYYGYVIKRTELSNLNLDNKDIIYKCVAEMRKREDVDYYIFVCDKGSTDYSVKAWLSNDKEEDCSSWISNGNAILHYLKSRRSENEIIAFLPTELERMYAKFGNWLENVYGKLIEDNNDVQFWLADSPQDSSYVYARLGGKNSAWVAIHMDDKQDLYNILASYQQVRYLVLTNDEFTRIRRTSEGWSEIQDNTRDAEIKFYIFDGDNRLFIWLQDGSQMELKIPNLAVMRYDVLNYIQNQRGNQLRRAYAVSPEEIQGIVNGLPFKNMTFNRINQAVVQDLTGGEIQYYLAEIGQPRVRGRINENYIVNIPFEERDIEDLFTAYKEITPHITIRVVNGITGENIPNAELEISYDNAPGKTKTNKFGYRVCEIVPTTKSMCIVARQMEDGKVIAQGQKKDLDLTKYISDEVIVLLKRTEICVYVTDPYNTPISGVNVEFKGEMAKTDKSGRADISLPHELDEDAQMIIFKQGYHKVSFSLKKGRLQYHVHEILLPLKHNFDIQVKSDTGEPLSGVEIFLLGVEIEKAPALSPTGSDGKAKFSLPWSENYELEFRKSAYKSEKKTILASDTKPIEITLYANNQ